MLSFFKMSGDIVTVFPYFVFLCFLMGVGVRASNSSESDISGRFSKSYSYLELSETCKKF